MVHNLVSSLGRLDMNGLTECHIGIIKTYTNIFNALTLSETKGSTGHLGKSWLPQDM